MPEIHVVHGTPDARDFKPGDVIIDALTGDRSLYSAGNELIALPVAVPPAYQVDAASFDGTAFLSRGSALTGVVDSATGTSMVWVKAASQTNDIFTTGSNQNFELGLNQAASGLKLAMYNAASSSDQIWGVTATVNDTWIGILTSWDNNESPPRRMACYVGGTLATKASIDATGSAFSVNYTETSTYFAADPFGDITTGDFADFLFWPGVSILEEDNTISVPNLALFFNESRPVDPAISIASLGSPAVMFSGGASGFATNQGTGGAFTLTGILTTASTSPTDPP